MKKGLTSSGHLKGMSNRHCFVSFPHSWKPLIADVKFPTFKIESAKHSLIVSWAGCSHDPGEDIDSICINSKLLQINNFSEGESVIVRQIRCPAPATNVCVSAVSDSDWEVLVLNADAASEAFLSQMRVIVSDQVFPLWLEGAAVVYLKVIKFSTSASLGLIQSNTQVEILPPYTVSSTWARHSPLVITPSKLTFEEESEICFKANFWYILYALFSLLRNSKKKIMYHPQQEALIEMRVIPYTMSINYKKSVLFTLIAYHPALVLISKKCLRPTMCQLPSYFIGKVSKINKKTSHNILPPSSRESTEKEVMAIILIWEMLKEKLDTEDIFELDALLKHKTCILSLSLTNKLSLEMEDIIALEICRGFNKSNYLTIDVTVKDDFPESKNLASCLTSLLGELCEICPVILNDFCEMNLNVEGKNIDNIIKTRDNLPVYLDKNTLATLSVNTDVELNEIQVNKSITESVTESKNGSPRILIHEEALEELIKLIKRDLMFDFNSSLLSPQFTLVQGSKGSGKTTLMEALIDRLTQKPFFIHCEIIHLKHLKGKKVDSVQKILKNAIKEARNFQPSIIVLDDIDFLAPAPAKTEEENGMLFEYTYYMAFMIKNLLTQLLESMKRSSYDFVSSRELITVVATCCSRNAVHSILSTPKGNHIFPKSIHIQLINEESKLKVLEGFLKHWHEQYLIENMTLFEKTDEQIFCYNKNEILFQLEGLTLSDIGILAHRIFLQSKARWKLQKDQCRNKCYIHEDVNNAFSGFVSLSSRGFKLPTSQQFKKIGGLQKARASLNEMIVWPSQYPGVFSQTKLRLRSGLLLYGPPGCGKTLLAQSFNSIAHLRFIAVKGPELLSKYIGQSEKSVRDAFERAQSVKPCVLFFDEFESIAPRRGHDNTGVTDRVVNQLLTQMDGVEGLSGVYVVAATSRPDLIDPALLRPGRLDKGIYCPIPDESERREILSVFAEEISSEETLDLTDLSQKTDGFTGADLQSLFTTAQMKAAEEMFGAALYKVALDEPTSSNSVIESESSSEEFITVLLSKNNGIETTAGLARISEKTSPTIAVNSDDHVTNQSSNKNCVSIRKEHIEKALGEIRPSVNEKERLKYEVMHKMFSSDDENKMFTVVMAGKRETLA